MKIKQLLQAIHYIKAHAKTSPSSLRISSDSLDTPPLGLSPLLCNLDLYLPLAEQEDLLNQLDSLWKQYNTADPSSLEKTPPANSPLAQLFSVGTLPGIKKLMAMPDIHLGYFFPIGTVAVFDTKNPGFEIYPSAIGPDINCGMRLIKTPFTMDDFCAKTKKEIADTLYRTLQTGFDRSSDTCMDVTTTHQVLEKGLDFVLNLNSPEFDWKITETGESPCSDLKDLPLKTNPLVGLYRKTSIEYEQQRTEKRGVQKLPLKIDEFISEKMLTAAQKIGSLGSGNHFMEVSVVQKVFDEETARYFGLKEGSIIFMVHTGSRSYGAATLNHFRSKCSTQDKEDSNLKIPFNSREGSEYISAFYSACNYAWVNRSIISRQVVSVLDSFFQKEVSEGYELVCDISHNSMEFVGDELVVRKGASRALGIGSEEIEEGLRNTGQPIVIGGSMGTSSFLLINKSWENNRSSICHGAGRNLSRGLAKKMVKKEDTIKSLGEKGIEVRCGEDALQTEAPEAYKDVEKVVQCCEDNGFVKKVLQVKPLIVIKD